MHSTEISRMNRRHWLLQAGAGFGGLALTHMLAVDGALGGVIRPEWNGGLNHAPKAKRVVQLFMNGGVSQVDSFDYKPTSGSKWLPPAQWAPS
jgi:hypothetical protein